MSARQRKTIDHKCDRTKMVAKCEIFVNVTYNCIGICRNKHDCQTMNNDMIINVKENNMVVNCKIFVVSRYLEFCISGILEFQINQLMSHQSQTS